MPSTPRILIVDDDSVITHLISLMLQNKGYNIVGKVTSVEEAVVKSADLNPDLIIMDIRLSGAMNGIVAAYTIFHSLSFLSLEQMMKKFLNSPDIISPMA